MAVVACCAVAVFAASPAAAALASPRASGAPGKAVVVTAGRYVLSGTARADLSAWPAREYAVDVLALVAPGRSPGELRLHLWSRGYACELRGRVDASHAISLDPGQTCTLESSDPGQRSRVQATLRSGTGRLGAEELALRVKWDVSGSATLPGGGTVAVPGTTIEVPLPDAPAVPVHGTVDAEARGPRERG